MFFLEVLINSLEAFLFFMLLRIAVGYERRYRLFAMFGWLLIAAFTTAADYFAFDHILYYILATVIQFCYAAFFFDHTNSMRFVYGFTLVLFSAVARSVVTFILPVLQPGSEQFILNGPKMSNGNPAFRIEVIVLYALVLLLLFLPAMYIRPKKAFFTKQHIVSMFIMVLLCISGTAVVLYFSIENMVKLDSTLPLGIVTVILLVIMVSIIVLFYKLAEIDRRYYDEQLELNKLRNERTRFEQIQATFDYLKKAKHDYNLHLRTIARMAGQAENAQIEKYISELTDNSPDGVFGVYTGNAAVDAVITESALTAEKQKIDFSAAVIAPDTVPLSDAEMCSVLGNLLDNALEASAKVDGERFINLLIDCNKNTMRIRVRNTSNGIYKADKSELLTLKPDSLDHGYGIKRIKEIVTKHNGMCSFIPKENYFEAIIYLPV